MRDGRRRTVGFAPRWWVGHVAVAVVVVAFGWLGWWQVQSFAASADAPPPPRAAAVALDTLTAPGGRVAPGDVGRRVTVEGEWDVAGQLLVPRREVAGRVGSLVVTPLRTDRGVVPVVRGWVPGEDAPPPPAAGRVGVTGVLQQSETEAEAAVPPGRAGEGRVAYVATVTLLERLAYGSEQLYDGYVALRSQQPPDTARLVPVPVRQPVATGDEVGRWRNLGYGLQWWVFGAAALFFWGSVLRRAGREARTQSSGPGSGASEGRQRLASPRGTT